LHRLDALKCHYHRWYHQQQWHSRCGCATIERITDENTGAISFSITPDDNHNGEDINISFDVSDGQGSEVASGASLTIAAVNDGPVGVNDTAATDEDTAIRLLVEVASVGLM
jgi:hypothetical protein